MSESNPVYNITEMNRFITYPSCMYDYLLQYLQYLHFETWSLVSAFGNSINSITTTISLPLVISNSLGFLNKYPVKSIFIGFKSFNKTFF